MESIQQRAAAFEADLDRRRLHVGKHEWSYYLGGDGPPVVLLPGGAGIAISWLDLTPALLPEHRVIAVDYPPTATSLDQLADGVLAILGYGEDRGDASDRPVGGRDLAEVLSAHAPRRVRSIVFTGTGLYGPEDIARLEGKLAATESTPWDQTRAAARAALRGAWRDSDDAEFWVEQVDAAYEKGGREGGANSLRCMLDLARRSSRLPRAWPGPVLLLPADDDPLITEKHVQRLRDRHPDNEFRSFPNGGHSLLLTRQADYITAVTGFLAQESQQRH